MIFYNPNFVFIMNFQKAIIIHIFKRFLHCYYYYKFIMETREGHLKKSIFDDTDGAGEESDDVGGAGEEGDWSDLPRLCDIRRIGDPLPTSPITSARVIPVSNPTDADADINYDFFTTNIIRNSRISIE